MAVFEHKGPDGATYEVTAPDEGAALSASTKESDNSVEISDLLRVIDARLAKRML